jgi:ribosomal protein S18 acetylase RimI-like enzyme
MAIDTRVTVRPRLAEDLAGLASLLIAVHAKDGYPVEGVSDAEAWLESPLMLGAWSALVGPALAGHVMLSEPGDDDASQLWMQRHHRQAGMVAVVGRLFVGPAQRGHGAGRALMEAAMTHATGMGRAAVLDVMDKDRDAIELYERLGWQRLGSFEHRYGGGVEPATAFEWTGAEGSPA